MIRKGIVFLAMGALVFFLFSASFAEIPRMINYQGKLTTAGGGCLNDTVQMTFSIYPDSLGSPYDWTETQMQVIVMEGIFSVLLGSVHPIPGGDTIFDGSVKYLGVRVEADPEMRPLKPMVTASYAFRSQGADTAEYARSSPGDDDWVVSGSDIYRLGGKVGIGTTPSQYRLEVVGEAVSGQPMVRIENEAGVASSARTLLVKGGEHASDIYTFGVADASNNVDFSVMGNGYVGIGTPSPNSRLEVAGTIHSTSGGYKFPDGSTQATAAIIPSGVIVMWSGDPDDIPSGWALCDGNNDTPNLEDRFVYGCVGGLDCPDGTGGAASHNHSVDVDSTLAGYSTSNIPNVTTMGGATLANHTHRHWVDPDPVTSSTESNLPPYYKLAFIMKL
jgi:hypothetical protein